jgi:hypothetical protein
MLDPHLQFHRDRAFDSPEPKGDVAFHPANERIRARFSPVNPSYRDVGMGLQQREQVLGPQKRRAFGTLPVVSDATSPAGRAKDDGGMRGHSDQDVMLGEAIGALSFYNRSVGAAAEHAEFR